MINEHAWYSISGLIKLANEGFLPFKSRNSWVELIKTGELKAIRNGTEDRFTYSIQGKDVIDCLNAIKTKSV